MNTKSSNVEIPLAVVETMFRGVDKYVPQVTSVPELLLRNRRNRAVNRIRVALESRGTANIPASLKKEIGELTRKWARDEFSDGLKDVEQFEIRCARERDLVLARESGDATRIMEVEKQDYLQQVKDQYGCIEIRGIQTTERILLNLDRVYVPLQLETSPSESLVERLDIAAIVQRRRAVEEVIAESRRVLIIGAPGSGKTTLVAYLATCAANGDLLKKSKRKRPLLPFVLAVRSFKRPSITVKSIARVAACDEELVRSSIENKQAVLLIDGLDEAPADFAPAILKSLSRFCKTNPDIHVIVTTRPIGTHDLRGDLPDFVATDLAAMARDEVNTFVDKWCLAAESSLSKNMRIAKQKAASAANDLKKRLDRSRPIQRLVTNPLLATILCVVHRFLGHRIPEHRVTLYDKCTDALLFEWDQSKFPEGAQVGKLDAPTKRSLLMNLARDMHEKKQAEVADHDVVAHFENELPNLGYSASDAPGIIEEIRDRSGILIERRPGYFAFSHLTFQEYLTALAFTPVEYTKLVNHARDPWWQEVIVLSAGTQAADSGKLATLLLRKRSDEGVFLAAQCLETAIKMPLDVRKRVETKLKERIPPKSKTQAHRLLELGIIAAPFLTRAMEDTRLSDEEWEFTVTALYETEYEPSYAAASRVLKHGRGAASVWALAFLLHGCTTSQYAQRVTAKSICYVPYKHVDSTTKYIEMLNPPNKDALLHALKNVKPPRPGRSRSRSGGRSG